MKPSDQQLKEILEVTDPLAVVLRGHQAVGCALDGAISQALPEPHALEVERLSFGLKVDLAISLNVLRPDSRGGFLALNGVRNRFAHRSDAAFEENDAKDFGNALSNWQRYLLGNELSSFTNPIDLLRHSIAVFFVECSFAEYRQRETKLADEVMHELVKETLAGAPEPAPDNPTFMKLRERLDSRKRECGLAW